MNNLRQHQHRKLLQSGREVQYLFFHKYIHRILYFSLLVSNKQIVFCVLRVSNDFPSNSFLPWLETFLWDEIELCLFGISCVIFYTDCCRLTKICCCFALVNAHVLRSANWIWIFVCVLYKITPGQESWKDLGRCRLGSMLKVPSWYLPGETGKIFALRDIETIAALQIF